MISFERLDSALQEMNVTLAEYEHFINNFSMDYKEEFLEDIILADIADDVDKLHSLYLEAMEYDSKMLAYCAKSRYETLTQMKLTMWLNISMTLENGAILNFQFFI